jgi:hypothetical protein
VTSIVFPDDGSFSLEHPAAQADLLATHDHAHTTATEMHVLLARHVWGALRGLGVTGGRMLVRGLDPELLAGLPLDERVLEPGDHADLQADIPPTAWRHPGLELTGFEPGFTPGLFDLVVLNTPFADVVYQDGGLREANWQIQNQGVLSALSYTAPGGITVALVSCDVLDAAEPGQRRAMTALADLLGAARLPAGALRIFPGCDNPVDLLLLRRRPDDQPRGGARFEESISTSLDGFPAVRLNEYFHYRPADMLGRPVAKVMPWGPPRLSVEPDPVPLDQDLASTLDHVVRNALRWRLTPRATTSTPPPGPGHRPRTKPGHAPGQGPERERGGGPGRGRTGDATGPDHHGPDL